MSSFSPPAQSGGPGANTQATAPFPDCWPPPAADSHLRISGRLPKHPLLTVLQNRNGLRAGHISWKEGGKWERRRRRPRTCDGLRPPPSTTPTLWNIPGTDLQGSGTISFPPPSFLGCRPARPQGNRELVLRREQRPGQEGLLHTSALGHVRATSSTNSDPHFPLPPAVRQKRTRPPSFPPPY